MEEKGYPVSEAVRLIGAPSHVLRYWEDELQIKVQRTSLGHRIYSEENIETFRWVKKLKEEGIQLKAIRILLEGSGAGRDAPLAEQIRGIEAAQDGNSRIMSELEASVHNSVSSVPDEDSAAKNSPEEDASVYEVIVAEQEPDNLQQFEEILKQMLEKVVSEQNEKLEQTLAAMIREELEELCLQYFGAAAEAAAAASEGSRKRSIRERIRRLLTGWGR